MPCKTSRKPKSADSHGQEHSKSKRKPEVIRRSANQSQQKQELVVH